VLARAGRSLRTRCKGTRRLLTETLPQFEVGAALEEHDAQPLNRSVSNRRVQAQQQRRLHPLPQRQRAVAALDQVLRRVEQALALLLGGSALSCGHVRQRQRKQHGQSRSPVRDGQFSGRAWRLRQNCRVEVDLAEQRVPVVEGEALGGAAHETAGQTGVEADQAFALDDFGEGIQGAMVVLVLG
jgi:hypothetical protein